MKNTKQCPNGLTHIHQRNIVPLFPSYITYSPFSLILPATLRFFCSTNCSSVHVQGIRLNIIKAREIIVPVEQTLTNRNIDFFEYFFILSFFSLALPSLMPSQFDAVGSSIDLTRRRRRRRRKKNPCIE